MEWVKNVNADARAAYVLTLSEKIMGKIENYEWFHPVRETMDLCWEWVEEKKHSGDDLYLRVDNEDGDGIAYFDEDINNSQDKLVWLCVLDAMYYSILQAYQYEREEYVPQAIEMVDDQTIDEFMEKIIQVEGYQEEWAERLKQYLLENYPASSDKKIKRDEILSQI